MSDAITVKPARERILDAAAAVMRENGLVGATTRLIAAEADYSEAMLYKHFADKQELFLAVLTERLPAVRPNLGAAGTGDLAENLRSLVEQLMGFFVQSFPIAASIFGAPELLAQHREGIGRRGFGPAAPIGILKSYLDAETDAGRIDPDADTTAAAQLLVGVAFHQGFLAAFEGATTVRGAHVIAAGAVATVLPGLVSRRP